MKGWLKMLTQHIAQTMLQTCPHCGRSLGFEFWRTSTACECGAYFCLNPQASRSLVPIYISGMSSERFYGKKNRHR